LRWREIYIYIYAETQSQICRTLCDFIFIFWINKRKKHEYLKHIETIIEISKSNRMEEKRMAEEQITLTRNNTYTAGGFFTPATHLPRELILHFISPPSLARSIALLSNG
jgi:hypothetical protein